MAIETLKQGDSALAGAVPYFSGTVLDEVFLPNYELLPQTNQLYELDLAYGEYKTLTPDEVIQRGAYDLPPFSVPRIITVQALPTA